MKRLNCILLFITVFCVTFITGCGGKSPETINPPDTGWDSAWVVPEDVSPEYVMEYPENEFTAQIIKPEHGSVDYIMDFSDDGRYMITFSGISQTEADEYIDKLEELGYSEIASEGNEVSVGTMLYKDGVYLSIAYTDSGMGMLITLTGDE